MLSSQLMQLMKSLTKHDFKEMRKVVRSPYFNQREDVVLLFDHIEKHLKDSTAIFIKEKIFENIFPQKKYDDTYMRQLMSYLYKITQHYLIAEQALSEEMNSNLLLLQALQLRNNDKLTEKQIENSMNYLDNHRLKNAKYHYYRYKVKVEEYEFKSKKQRNVEAYLADLPKDLEHFFYSESMRLACNIISHQTVSKNEYQQKFINPIIENIRTEESVPSSVLAYFYMYQTMRNPEDTSYFQALKKIIENQINEFSPTEQRDLVISAANYCIKKLNQGDKGYGIQALEIYRLGLQSKALFENDSLLPFVYKNILMLALKTEEYIWAEKFIYDFKQYLPEKDRENIFEYNLALYYFRVGKYKEAMPLLQKVNLNDVLYNLDSRRLLARIYFEQNEINPLISLIESAKVYLHRQKGIGYHHEMYVNYFRFLEKMLKIDMKNIQARTILRGEVERTQLLAERDWLLQILS